jgi:hypothetical protein
MCICVFACVRVFWDCACDLCVCVCVLCCVCVCLCVCLYVCGCVCVCVCVDVWLCVYMYVLGLLYCGHTRAEHTQVFLFAECCWRARVPEMGYSWCRFDTCSASRRSLGCCNLTDGTFVWPEGLAHYVRDHGGERWRARTHTRRQHARVIMITLLACSATARRVCGPRRGDARACRRARGRVQRPQPQRHAVGRGNGRRDPNGRRHSSCCTSGLHATLLMIT